MGSDIGILEFIFRSLLPIFAHIKYIFPLISLLYLITVTADNRVNICKVLFKIWNLIM